MLAHAEALRWGGGGALPWVTHCFRRQRQATRHKTAWKELNERIARAASRPAFTSSAVCLAAAPTENDTGCSAPRS